MIYFGRETERVSENWLKRQGQGDIYTKTKGRFVEHKTGLQGVIQEQLKDNC